MKTLVLLILIFLLNAGCSGLFISKRYAPAADANWKKLENRTYGYSLQLDSSMIEIRTIPVKDVGFIGPILAPIIPVIINNYKHRLYFDLHIGLNDTISMTIPPAVYLYNPITSEIVKPIEISPVNFKLIKELKLYHRDFEYSGKYCINRTYLYRFDLHKKEPILYFRIDSLGKHKDRNELVKYEVKKRVKYKPIIIPRPT